VPDDALPPLGRLPLVELCRSPPGGIHVRCHLLVRPYVRLGPELEVGPQLEVGPLTRTG